MNNNIRIINNVSKELEVVVTKVGNEIVATINPYTEKVELSSLQPGSIFTKYTGTQYILLEFDQNGNACILRKDLLPEGMEFGNTNNFNGSSIDTYLNSTYSQELNTEFGLENVIEQELDLTSMDGLTDYGKIRRKVGLLPFNVYRRCRYQIGEVLNDWWWLLDANSTPSGTGDSYVQYVYSDGDLDCNFCDWNGKSVRPFFILKSDTLVSLV